jgi:hypothetical protein
MEKEVSKGRAWTMNKEPSGPAQQACKYENSVSSRYSRNNVNVSRSSLATINMNNKTVSYIRPPYLLLIRRV